VMRLISYHPGTEVKSIKAHTGFELVIATDIEETQLPDPAELRLLREEIDPQGIRRLESLSGAARRRLLHQIIAAEASD
jgi:hypothetical protein